MKNKKGFLIAFYLFIIIIAFIFFYFKTYDYYFNELKDELGINTDKSICELYSEQDLININYINGTKYYKIENITISEQKLWEDCLK